MYKYNPKPGFRPHKNFSFRKGLEKMGRKRRKIRRDIFLSLDLTLFKSFNSPGLIEFDKGLKKNNNEII